MTRANIRKRPHIYKGKIDERWVVTWTDLKGKRREYSKCRNRRHAEAYAARIDRELSDHIHVADRATVPFKKVAQASVTTCLLRPISCVPFATRVSSRSPTRAWATWRSPKSSAWAAVRSGAGVLCEKDEARKYC
jgi:hypothetical protein